LKKRSRIELVVYSSSPEKAQEETALSSDSDMAVDASVEAGLRVQPKAHPFWLPSSSQPSSFDVPPFSDVGTTDAASDSYPDIAGDLPIASDSDEQLAPSSIASSSHPSAPAAQAENEMKAALKAKVTLAAKPFTAAHKQNRAKLKEFKLKLIKKQAPVGQVDGEPSSAQRLGR
jgi:hypothetical protein